MSGEQQAGERKSSLEKFQLAGKIALVIGASRGIGRAIALGLAEAGCDVVLVSRKLPDLEAVAREIAGLGRKALPIPANVRHLEEINDMVSKAVSEFGRIDILVNNAGINPLLGSVFDIDERAWDGIIGLNLKGFFFLSQAVGKIMKDKGGGNIINISSVSGLRPDMGMGVYCISKAGIVMLTQVLAQEWGQYNIRVNTIAPAIVKTRFSEPIWSDPELYEKTVENITLGRMAEPEDIVGAALFLASEASSYMTGQALVLDGGRFAPAPAGMLAKRKRNE
jgi:NAD(P)-dependent dehydrogenase (short-subunit alcohol dehydrogenase family)